MNKIVIFTVGCLALAANSMNAQDPGFREAEPRRLSSRSAQNTQTPSAPTTDDTAGSVANITSMAALDDTRPLRIGDRVSLRIVENRDEVRSLLVQDSGDINTPFLNLVKAAGRTCKEVAYEMKRELEKQYFQQATVIIALEQARLERGGMRPDEMEYITIYGQVMRQGRYELAPEEELTVSQAVLRAGGLSQFAKKDKVKLIRTYPGGVRKNFIINLDDIMRKGRLQFDVPIRSNDVIIVDENLVNF
jgi:polysaccharide export outer membrane protein